MIFSDIVGIIADDLTGANDTALQFHLRGANTKILLDSQICEENKRRKGIQNSYNCTVYYWYCSFYYAYYYTFS